MSPSSASLSLSPSPCAFSFSIKFTSAAHAVQVVISASHNVHKFNETLRSFNPPGVCLSVLSHFVVSLFFLRFTRMHSEWLTLFFCLSFSLSLSPSRVNVLSRDSLCSMQMLCHCECMDIWCIVSLLESLSLPPSASFCLSLSLCLLLADTRQPNDTLSLNSFKTPSKMSTAGEPIYEHQRVQVFYPSSVYCSGVDHRQMIRASAAAAAAANGSPFCHPIAVASSVTDDGQASASTAEYGFTIESSRIVPTSIRNGVFGAHENQNHTYDVPSRLIRKESNALSSSSSVSFSSSLTWMPLLFFFFFLLSLSLIDLFLRLLLSPPAERRLPP